MNKILEKAGLRGLPAEGWLLVVDVARQVLEVYAETRRLHTYPISTGRAGTGEQEGSRCTPTGWHEIADRIGADAALGQPFQSREPVGNPIPETAWRGRQEDDLILTRILRLRGLEPGRNAGPGIDSYQRYIYIHGTNHENQLGQPASGGCVRMANRDIAELSDALADHPAGCWIG